MAQVDSVPDGHQDGSISSLTISQNEMHSIYMQLSVSDCVEFDTTNFLTFVENTILQIFDEKILKLENTVFISSDDLLNMQFVKLLKHLLDNSKIRKNQVGFVFVEFCDFFDLDEAIVYTKLHHKLQQIIRTSAEYLCDADIYKSYKKRNESTSKYQGIVIRSIFDL